METQTINGMEITETSMGHYSVKSTSGNTYTVKYCGSGDGDPDYVALWECDCPAGQHGRDCKHVKAVIQYVDNQNS
jgi:hypothetical protein